MGACGISFVRYWRRSWQLIRRDTVCLCGARWLITGNMNLEIIASYTESTPNIRLWSSAPSVSENRSMPGTSTGNLRPWPRPVVWQSNWHRYLRIFYQRSERVLDGVKKMSVQGAFEFRASGRKLRTRSGADWKRELAPLPRAAAAGSEGAP